MSLHRKDFVALAKILNNTRTRLEELGDPIASDISDELLHNILKFLADTNEQFDKVRFIHAVTERPGEDK